MIQGDTPQKAALDYRVTSGANQFYWIAGLGVVNSILYAVNSIIFFPMGLAVTQLLTAVSRGQVIEMRAVTGLAVLAFSGDIRPVGLFCQKRRAVGLHPGWGGLSLRYCFAGNPGRLVRGGRARLFPVLYHPRAYPSKKDGIEFTGEEFLAELL